MIIVNLWDIWIILFNHSNASFINFNRKECVIYYGYGCKNMSHHTKPARATMIRMIKMIWKIRFVNFEKYRETKNNLCFEYSE